MAMRARPRIETLAEGMRCDPNGCVARLADGRAVALSLTAEGAGGGLRGSRVVVTARNAPPGCAATDHRSRRAHAPDGAMAAMWDGRTLVAGGGAAADLAASLDDRAAGASHRRSRRRAIRCATVDATPRPQDLEPDELGSVAPE